MYSIDANPNINKMTSVIDAGISGKYVIRVDRMVKTTNIIVKVIALNTFLFSSIV